MSEDAPCPDPECILYAHPGEHTDVCGNYYRGSAVIGELLDGLGVVATLSPDDMPTDALVLLKVVQADGSVRMVSAWSDGMSWIERIGMLEVGRHEEMRTIPTAEER